MSPPAMDLVDIHSHMLWGLDDGCRSPEETLEAARAFASLGYTDLAPSPHAQARYPGGDPDACAARLEEARALFAAEGLRVRLHRNSESVLGPEYLASLARGQARGMGALEHYALVELPFLDAVPDLTDLLGRIRDTGVVPVVAHPERCMEFDKPGRAAEAVRAGAALQLNIGSPNGRHGPMAAELSARFLDAGLYALGGTDLHGPHGAAEWIDEALTVLERRVGVAAVRRLCSENPLHALHGEPLA
jgi:protein-tyrosine phosphatase